APVGRARASLLAESRRDATWERAPLVLPRRRLRLGTEEGTRARHPARRGAAREPEHSNRGILAPGSGRILRHNQCALCAQAREKTAEQALAADEGARLTTFETWCRERESDSSTDDPARTPRH